MAIEKNITLNSYFFIGLHISPYRKREIWNPNFVIETSKNISILVVPTKLGLCKKNLEQATSSKLTYVIQNNHLLAFMDLLLSNNNRGLTSTFCGNNTCHVNLWNRRNYIYLFNGSTYKYQSHFQPPHTKKILELKSFFLLNWEKPYLHIQKSCGRRKTIELFL